MDADTIRKNMVMLSGNEAKINYLIGQLLIAEVKIGELEERVRKPQTSNVTKRLNKKTVKM